VHGEKITYHDLCFLGRHNKVYSPPREIIDAVSGTQAEEALALDPDTISTACPYCMVILGDAVNAKKAAGETKQTLEVIDVSQLLVRAIKLREETPERPQIAEPVPDDLNLN
jgi:Fe-S oxidoreductase